MFQDDRLKDIQTKLNTEGKASFLAKKAELENRALSRDPQQTAPSQTAPITSNPDMNPGAYAVINSSQQLPTRAPVRLDPTKQNPGQTNTNANVLRRLRTYEGDVAETIRNNNVSQVTISMAEQRKREVEAEEPSKTRVFLKDAILTIMSIVLIIAGIGAIAGFYYIRSTSKPEPVIHTAPTLVPADKTFALSIAGLAPSRITSTIEEERIATTNLNGSVTHLNLTTSDGDTAPRIETPQLLTALDINTPGPLSRAFDKEFMLGIHAIEQKPLFLLIKLGSFDSAFAGMLNWEGEMLTNLKFLTAQPVSVTPASTATSTPSTGSGQTSPTPSRVYVSNEVKTAFEDLIIKNKDTRVLYDVYGNIVLLYSFLDKETLLITTSEKTFNEILNRFISLQLVR